MNYVHIVCDYRPVMDTMGERLKWARERKYPSARRAALEGLRMRPSQVSTYSAHENGQNDFGPEDAERYAKAFGVNAGWLLTGEGTPGPRKTKLMGDVGAGAVVDPFDDDAVEEIDLPPGAPHNAVAVRVRGSSMYPRYFDGEKLFYVKDGRTPTDLLNKECVIRLKSGGMLVKTIKKGSKRGFFTLQSWSHEDLPDQAIDWAAHVRWTVRGE